MKTFYCRCGNGLFFDNTRCIVCGLNLGFDPLSQQLLSFEQLAGGAWQTTEHRHFKPCQNYRDYQVCNWMLPFDSEENYCLACALNEMIPALSAPQRRRWWGNMETAKRHLLYSLLSLQLPVQSRSEHAQGLAFAFLEDKRMNPAVAEDYVATGYRQGLITVNLAEADELSREMTRVQMNEPYRTLLGHFRHESGHYYFERLIRDDKHLVVFRQLFGDESLDYASALANYYENQRSLNSAYTDPSSPFISCYAQAHPLEDWAECWAHYLHMTDTTETAAQFGIIDADIDRSDFSSWSSHWERVTVALNALNRSMGLRDAYPFVLSDAVLTKIHFVHRVIDPR
ncbi:MAG: putative zinc-binding metallopeptidase [Halioglobus sp.]|nr:putative zinc-binding metallopeptidase [Halioglobus sp.]